MRYAWLVPFVTVPMAACASGGGGDGPVGTGTHETPDSGPGSPSGDAGFTYGADSGPGTDSGTVDGAPTLPPDGGTLPLDGGTPDTGTIDATAADSAPTDSGADAPPFDGPVVLGESCTAPIDISAGGTFAIDTCSLTNSVAASCGTTTAAGILRGVAPTSGSTYSITFPTGWVLQELDDTCAPMTFDCGSTGTWGVSGATLGGYWYFAIEPVTGTCGTASVTVDRIM